MPVSVSISPSAARELDKLTGKVHTQVIRLMELLEAWPEVSGVKAMKGEWKGAYRVRTGDWRVVFTVDESGTEGKAIVEILVVKIGNRKDVYD